MDINLLLEPRARGSESPASKKSSVSNASHSTGATRGYTTAPSAYTQSPAQRASPAYAASPPYAVPQPYGQISGYAQAPTSAPQGPGSMLGGPVLPAISELQRRPDAGNLPQFRALYAGPHGPAPSHHGPPGTNGSPPSTLKRQASQTPLPDESPAKKQSKWTPEEDNLTIELRGQGMKWDDIAKRLPGRSSISCRLRYQNYLEKRAIWDEEKKNKLARLYARYVQSNNTGQPTWLNLVLSALSLVVYRCKSPARMRHISHRLPKAMLTCAIDSRTRCGRRLLLRWVFPGDPPSRCTGSWESRR